MSDQYKMKMSRWGGGMNEEQNEECHKAVKKKRENFTNIKERA